MVLCPGSRQDCRSNRCFLVGGRARGRSPRTSRDDCGRYRLPNIRGTPDARPLLASAHKTYLPVATTAADPPAPPVETTAFRGTETVLVVEDQAGVPAVIEQTLHRFGYTVLATATGSEAVATARAHRGPIHVMLTDVVLPGWSGREVARQVVAVRRTVRVLYMSGYTEDAIVQHGVLAPGLAFIQKPFTGADLFRRIHEVLAAEPPPSF